MNPPDLVTFAAYGGNWAEYEQALYEEYLASVAHGKLVFQGAPVKVRFHPASNHKGYGFWHVISEAPSQDNRNEEDRVPDLQRCERIRWIAWCIENAGQPGMSWWENQRGPETHVVIWAEQHDFAVILAKRDTAQGPRYYLLKSSYHVHQRRQAVFRRERDAFWA